MHWPTRILVVCLAYLTVIPAPADDRPNVLYDHVADPNELSNLARNPETEPRRAEFRKSLPSKDTIARRPQGLNALRQSTRLSAGVHLVPSFTGYRWTHIDRCGYNELPWAPAHLPRHADLAFPLMRRKGNPTCRHPRNLAHPPLARSRAYCSPRSHGLLAGCTADDLNQRFKDAIRPLLATYCVDCHSDDGRGSGPESGTVHVGRSGARPP